MPKGDKFTVGDLVFGKVKGYPPWPARIIGMTSKDRFKVYFYGTYETASLKNEDIWIYNADNKEKFASKNMKRKGYPEGMDQLENNPEIAGVEDDVPLSDLKTPTTATSVAADTPASKKKTAAKDTPKSTPRAAPDTDRSTTEKRKAAEDSSETAASAAKVQKRAADVDVKASSKKGDSTPATGTGRTNRSVKPKKLDTSDTGSPSTPAQPTTAGGGRRSRVAADGKENSSPAVSAAAAGARSTGKSAMTPEEEKSRKLEKRKHKLRWLRMEQRLVELDIAVKSSLHLERPSPDRCISALEELNELAIVPFMLKKQPDIVTTVRRLRKYIGPHSFNQWSDQDAKRKMEKSIEIIQKKADQIYNKFKSYFAYQAEKPFSTMFEEEVQEFKKVTKGMDEGKVLSMVHDPTATGDGNLSDED